LTEVLFEDAIEQARELDGYFDSHKKLVGPLHGIPISLKDQFNVAGVDTTLGYVGRSFKPAKADAALVVILRKLGAVIIAKTNLPQSILVS
jgi:amidase